MYDNLKVKELGGFNSSFYLSSSEGNSGGAWRQYFSNGSQSLTNGLYSFYVRAIRAF